MLKFKDFLREENNIPRNTGHLMHIEDAVLYGGVDGTRRAINAIRGIRDTLAGNSDSAINATTKFDGAPAIFCGIDPIDQIAPFRKKMNADSGNIGGRF